MSTAGRPIECKAAVARGVGDLRIETITVAPPQPGEVRLKVRSACSLASWAPTLSRYIRMHCVTPTSTHWREVIPKAFSPQSWATRQALK